MKLNEALLAELAVEAPFTRVHLERVPMDRLDFKPHERSMTLGWLATFTAVLPTWGIFTLGEDSFDVAPRGAPPMERRIASSRQELLAMFDKNMTGVRAALAATSDAELRRPWSLLAGGEKVFTQPRFLVFRTFFLNHLIHHRAQLGMFLRFAGVSVPAIYNDSADEKGGMFVGPPR